MGAKGVKQITKEQRAQARQIYDRTLSTTETAAQMGLSRVQVMKELKRQGVQLSSARGGACYRHIDDVRQWAAEGLSLTEIAHRIGTTHHKVSAFLKKHNIPYRPFSVAMENNPRWRGGRIIDKDGYVLVKRPDHPARDRHNYVREHRLVMEGVLGRYLQPQEVVHHKDGDKQNNTPVNLEVFGTNAEHLAETLQGQRPNWTAEGWERMKAPKRPRASRAHTSTPE